MMEQIDVNEIITLQYDLTRKWHEQAVQWGNAAFYSLVAANHGYNFQLWHEEDKARRDDKGYEYVYHAKRNIDELNQLRNDMIERIDQWIIKNYPPMKEDCPANSETPGMIIDRLSILALKEYHMLEQAQRTDAEEHHLQICRQKSHVIQLQLTQLATALTELLDEIAQQKRRFNVYHQFKMYNDPNLNPQLYKNRIESDAKN